jgi:uncharacterized protein YdeI (YjbR/CyaY-like superfamily)
MPQVPPNSFQPRDRAAWRDWLIRNHQSEAGVWLITFKKSAGKPTVSYDESVEEALCVGWIDSRPGKLDDERTMLWFSPRKPKSVWARTNKDRIRKLTAAGLMLPAGLSAVKIAKANGSWNALDEVEQLKVPEDLTLALADHPPAAKHFQAFPPGVRKGILQWIAQAKTAVTRAKRIHETATKAAKNERANQWQSKS